VTQNKEKGYHQQHVIKRRVYWKLFTSGFNVNPLYDQPHGMPRNHLCSYSKWTARSESLLTAKQNCGIFWKVIQGKESKRFINC